MLIQIFSSANYEHCLNKMWFTVSQAFNLNGYSCDRISTENRLDDNTDLVY